MSPASDHIDAMLHETRVIPPSAEFQAAARVRRARWAIVANIEACLEGMCGADQRVEPTRRRDYHWRRGPSRSAKAEARIPAGKATRPTPRMATIPAAIRPSGVTG